jgi:hypothetical protein
MFAPLTIEGVHPPVRRGLGARFRSLDRCADLTALKCCGAGWTHEECEKVSVKPAVSSRPRCDQMVGTALAVTQMSDGFF